MGDRIGAGLAGYLDQPLGNQRTRDRGAEQVIALIASICAHHREHEIAHEFLTQIVDEDVLVGNPHQLRLGARGLELLALPEVGSEGDDLAIIGHLQPFEDDRGVEPARIGEHHAVNRFACVVHARRLGGLGALGKRPLLRSGPRADS